MKALADSAQGLSHAEITRAAEEAVKNAVMHDHEHVNPKELQELLQRRPLRQHRNE